MEQAPIPFHKGLPLIRQVPKWCCPYCGEQVGYMGNWLALLFGTSLHGCTFSNVRTSPTYQAWMARKRDV